VPAVEHGATKRELLEAVQAAAVPGGDPTLSGAGRQVRYVLPVGLRG
jgi:alkylhydroperoxidase/carboxymuconolactone decarboxylase family protein YurZ